MEAGVVAGARSQQALGAPLVDGRPDDLVTLAVDAAGPAQVALQAALGDEPVQGLLGEARRLDVGQLPPRRRGLDQRAGHDHEPEAERGGQVLGERADVEDAPGPVQPVQRLERAVGVAVLGVVVVLDDGHVVLLGEGQQRPPPGQAHGGAGRGLVGRGGVDQPDVGRDPVDHDALVVDGDGGDPHPHGRPEVADRRVPRLLDGGVIARAQQDPGDEVDRLLGAGGDDKVLGRRLDAPGAADPVGQGPPQLQQPGGVAVALGDLLEGGHDALAPLDEGEEGRIGPADAEVERDRRPGQGAGPPGAAERPAGARRRPAWWAWARRWRRRTCLPRPALRGSPRRPGGRRRW